jgi:hypothetical protein
VFSSVVALTAFPPVSALVEDGLLGAFRYLSADSFYYLAVADHSTGAPFFTFDGVHPTNGFHPLWQLYLETSFRALELRPERQIQFCAISSVLFTALGTGLFALALLRLTQRPWLALLGSVPGFFFLMVPRIHPSLGSQWSFANGMESPLSILFFGALVYALFARGLLRDHWSRARGIALSVLLTLSTLARLDDIFIFAPFLLFIAATATSRRDASMRVASASLIPTLVIGGYLAYNLSHAGSLLPSSGTAKLGGVWSLAQNAYATLLTIAPFVDRSFLGLAIWSSKAWHVVQMLAPALVSVGWILWHGIPGRQPTRHADCPLCLIGLLGGYVLLKSGYNFVFVSIWNQGHWYYPLTIMSFNAMIAVWCAQLIARRASPEEGAPPHAILRRWPALSRLPAATAVVGVLLLVTAYAFVDTKRTSGYHRKSHDFWMERAQIQRGVNLACPGCGVLAFDDGIISYSLETIPTLNAFGLAADAEALEALGEGRLLRLAWERGHRLIATVNYAESDYVDSDAGRLLESLRAHGHLHDEALDQWTFEVVFESPRSAVSFVRFQPNDQRAEPPAG